MVESLNFRAKFFRFTLIGALTFVIYEGLFIFLSSINLPIFFAVFSSYSIAVTAHFLLNRTHTFGSSKTRIGMQASKYIAVAFFNIIFQSLIIGTLIDNFSASFLIASTLGAVITTTFSFFLLQVWVFKKGRI